MTALEQLVRQAWHAWGDWAKSTTCSGCGTMTHCRAKRFAGPWLCLDCFDQKQ